MAEKDVTTATHIVIQGLCCNARGGHFAVRVQVSPRMSDLVEGEETTDKYYLSVTV